MFLVLASINRGDTRILLNAHYISASAFFETKKKKHKHTTNDTHTYRLHDALKLNQQR